MSSNPETHAGYIAIVGRPNVGKSTLLNKILGKKISITARKAQTTRHKILGIKTTADSQAIYVDTPGIHKKSQSSLNSYMNKAALSTLGDVDLIVFVVSGTAWQEEDELVLKALDKVGCPVILALNKVDLVTQKGKLLAFIDELSKKREFHAVVPISAEKGTNVADLEAEVNKLLPVGQFYFPQDQATDRDEKFLASEIIREKLTRFLGEEIPYAVSVIVDQIKEKKGVKHIDATIYVERRGQKIIIVGKEGAGLKKIGTEARKDLEKLFSGKVFLRLWVKIKTKWTSDERLLQQFGYGD